MALVSSSINNGKVSTLPWEDILLAGGRTEKFPEACNIPEPFLVEIRRGRENMLRHFHGQCTLAEWQTTVKKHTEAIQSLNFWFSIDAYFLEHYAGAAMHERARAAILNVLPKEEETPGHPQCDVKLFRQQIFHVTRDLARVETSKVIQVSDRFIRKEVHRASGFLESMFILCIISFLSSCRGDHIGACVFDPPTIAKCQGSS